MSVSRLGFKKNGSEYRSRFDVFTTRWIVLCHSIPLLDRAHTYCSEYPDRSTLPTASSLSPSSALQISFGHCAVAAAAARVEMLQSPPGKSGRRQMWGTARTAIRMATGAHLAGLPLVLAVGPPAQHVSEVDYLTQPTLHYR